MKNMHFPIFITLFLAPVMLRSQQTDLPEHFYGNNLLPAMEYPAGQYSGPGTTLDSAEDDMENLLDSTIVYEWSNATSEWKKNLKTENTYSQTGEPIDNVLRLWQNNNWLPLTRYNTVYDAADIPVEQIQYAWKTALNDWQPSTRQTMIYDGGALPQERHFYKWSVTQQAWTDYYKYIISYDQNGNIEELTRYFIDTLSNTWDPREKYETVYDANDRPLSYVYFTRSPAQVDWLPNLKYLYTYDSSADTTLATVRTFNWNVQMQDWEMTKEEYSSTVTAGNVKEEISYLRDFSTANWIPKRKRDYLSDADSLLSQVFTYQWGNSWDWQLRQDYYWSQHNTTDTHAEISSDDLIYPNPVRDWLSIKNLHRATWVELYSALGVQVKKRLLDGMDSKIDLSDLPAGTYFIRWVRENGTTTVRPIIKL